MAAGMAMAAFGAQGQQGPNGERPLGGSSSLDKGSVYVNLRGKQVSQSVAESGLLSLLGLSELNAFVKVSDKKDDLGFRHLAYQQYFQGVRVEGGQVLMHLKDGAVTSVNGRMAPIAALDVKPVLDKEEAMASAKSALGVYNEIRRYPVELCIATAQKEGADYALAYKVRLDGENKEGKLVMENVYIDAKTGKLIGNHSLIAHVHATGTAQTLYRGQKTINIDSTATGFRLYDNIRKIETLDAGGVEMANGGSDPFPGARGLYNDSKVWSEQPSFMNMTLTSVTNNMLVGLGFQNLRFVAGLVLKGDTVNNEVISWPDLKLQPTTTLPVHARNLFVFPTDTDYFGVFGKLELMTETFSDTAFAHLSTLAPGIYDWEDKHGNKGKYEIVNSANPALDAHWGMGVVHDYYMDVFGRDSYDGNGSVVRNYMNGVWPMVLNQNNAAALPAPYSSMVYGYGDGEFMNPVVGLNVMGHEFTHMVTENNGNGGLQYEGEPGALNESFSDIFGVSIEAYENNGVVANWTVGNDVIVGGGYMRSMSNPKDANDPDTYKGTYWVSTTSQNDNGGVHTNSGVQNKWYYLLTEGGSGTNDKGDNYSVTGIGIEKAQQIAYRSLTNYLVYTSKYINAYHGSLQAVQDLYGDTTTQEYKAVKDAWFAVGIGDDEDVPVEELGQLAQGVSLYPNPASGRVTIQSEFENVLKAQIVNIVGKQLMAFDVKKGANVIDIAGLPKGIYLIKYERNGAVHTEKLSVL